MFTQKWPYYRGSFADLDADSGEKDVEELQCNEFAIDKNYLVKGLYISIVLTSFLCVSTKQKWQLAAGKVVMCIISQVYLLEQGGYSVCCC